MRNLTATLCLTIAVLLGSAGVSESADLQKGLTAARNGDMATALREWKPLAEQGNARAQYFIGMAYAMGKGVPQDDKTAVKWFRLSVEQGYSNAQNYLGQMYYKGRGVTQNSKTALKWFRLAAKQGNPKAKNNVKLLEKLVSENPEGILAPITQVIPMFDAATARFCYKNQCHTHIRTDALHITRQVKAESPLYGLILTAA